MNKTIQKRSSATIQQLRQIRDGKNKNYIFCEGFPLLEELLKSNIKTQNIYATQKTKTQLTSIFKKYKQSIPEIILLNNDVMSFVSDLDTPPGLIAIAERPEHHHQIQHDKNISPLIVILHGIQLPQNVGTILRTGEAAGATGFWLTTTTANPFGPKALRTSAGSALRVKIRTKMSFKDALNTLQTNQIHIHGITQNGTVLYTDVDWTIPTALVFGPEGRGFQSSELKAFKSSVRIPMAGAVESLNVGVSLGICLFEANRQRKK